MSSHAEVVASLVSEYSGHEKKIAELQESVERLMMEVCRLRNRISWQDYEHRICMYEVQQDCEEKLINAFMSAGTSMSDMEN